MNAEEEGLHSRGGNNQYNKSNHIHYLILIIINKRTVVVKVSFSLHEDKRMLLLSRWEKDPFESPFERMEDQERRETKEGKCEED